MDMTSSLSYQVHQIYSSKMDIINRTYNIKVDAETENNPVRIALTEDQEDLSAFEERANETTISYEELLNDLESHGKL